MDDKEKDEVLADVAEVAAAMLEKSLERRSLQLKEGYSNALLTAAIFNLLDDNTEAMT